MNKPKNNATTNTNTEKNYIKVDKFTVDRATVLKNDSVTFDLTLNGVKIYGCFVVEGKNGDFIAFPQRKADNGKYYHYCYANLSPEDSATILQTVELAINQ